MYEIMITEHKSKGGFTHCVIPVEDDALTLCVQDYFENDSECVRLGILDAFTILVIRDEFVSPTGYAPPITREYPDGS